MPRTSTACCYDRLYNNLVVAYHAHRRLAGGHGASGGQNLVILAIAFPTLVISAVFASCGSERVSDIAGRSDPLIYIYGIHAFATCFNPLLLVYMALLDAHSMS